MQIELTEQIIETRQRLLDWYRAKHRDLPWRHTRDPYKVLVSEVMLQQTQASRVIPFYHEFLARFPTVHALADAPTAEVIRAWSGLGYNRRALNLQRTCRAAIEQFGGALPTTVVELEHLPGIGPYTAGAIACFAYEADVGFVDTNIRRVLQRWLLGPEHTTPAPTARVIQQLAQDLVPPGEGYAWNQGLIELGATVCRARAVECERCPLADHCRARPTIAALLANDPRPARKREPKFETTARYLRGRIIACAGAADAAGCTLTQFAEAAGRELDDVIRQVERLVDEGLLEAVPGVAEDAPPYDDKAGSDERRFRLPH